MLKAWVIRDKTPDNGRWYIADRCNGACWVNELRGAATYASEKAAKGSAKNYYALDKGSFEVVSVYLNADY
jgi:hypothetical protein